MSSLQRRIEELERAPMADDGTDESISPEVLAVIAPIRADFDAGWDLKEKFFRWMNEGARVPQVPTMTVRWSRFIYHKAGAELASEYIRENGLTLSPRVEYIFRNHVTQEQDPFDVRRLLEFEQAHTPTT